MGRDALYLNVKGTDYLLFLLTYLKLKADIQFTKPQLELVGINVLLNM